MIRLILLGSLAFALFYAVSQKRRAMLPAITVASVSLIGMFLVLFPDVATQAAHFVGVGRGVDLVFYCFIVLTIVIVFNIHLRLRAEKEQMTAVARAIAIVSASKPAAER